MTGISGHVRRNTQQGDRALTSFGFPAPDSSPENNRITRIEADGDAVSELGFVHHGRRIRIAQENEPGAVASITGNHSSSYGNDALSVMSVIATLDLRFANDAARLSQILRGASSRGATTFEDTLDSLRRLLMGSSFAKTAVSSGGDDPKRTELYNNIDAFVKSSAFTALVGKVQVDLRGILGSGLNY